MPDKSPRSPEELEQLKKDVQTLKVHYDLNKDGQLSDDEIRLAAQDYTTKVSPQHVVDIVQRWDVNRDGAIDEAEFQAFVADVKSTDTAVRYAAYIGPVSRFARYLAYMSDVGEAFRPVINRTFVRLGYAVSWGYCAGDVAYEAYKAHSRHGVQGGELAQLVVERSIFQSVASMLLPAATIHTAVHCTMHLTHRWPRAHKWGPTAAGLALVPLLPVLYDHPVEHALHRAFARFGPFPTRELQPQTN
eukprot:EG_transcript_20265